MTEVIKESFVGQCIYIVSGRRVFSYPEERPGFDLPEKYRQTPREKPSRFQNEDTSPDSRDGNGEIRMAQDYTGDTETEGQERPGRPSRPSDETVVGDTNHRQGDKDKDKDKGGEKKGAGDGDGHETIVVDWYGPDDPENPQNWSIWKKCWTTFCIMLITISVYMGSSIVSPSIMQISEVFSVGPVVSTLTLSLFVVGYGVGPLFLSPISEIPQIGRSIPYIITLAIFCILQVPTALVDNFAGLGAHHQCILRFLAGFVGSPPLATGGASLQDVFHPKKLPYAMGLYGLAAASGPAIAPVVSGYAVVANGWRWAFWEMLWLSGFSLLLLGFTMPETSSANILFRRAKRLRKLTGNTNIKSQGEIDSQHMTGRAIAMMTLIRPISMTFTEPIVLAIDLYIGLVYAILYSYFESFPIVYLEGYMFFEGNANLPFLALLVGSLISYAGYCLWNRLYFEEKFVETGGKIKPEARLPMSFVAAFCFPVCLFWFAWTANRTHWISPVIASAFFGLGATWMFMPFLTYLPHAYPAYAASVLASNDFFRSMMGAGMPLAARPLFNNLGIDWGNTLLGCLTVLFIPIPFVLYRYGPWLRSKSPMALHDDEIEDEKRNPMV